MSYKEKYLKYKNKYLDLKNQYGGSSYIKASAREQESQTGYYLGTKYIKAVTDGLKLDNLFSLENYYRIPENTNVIIFRNIDVSLPIQEIDSYLEKYFFYTDGNTTSKIRNYIFTNYDKSKTKTNEGRELEQYINTIKPVNHPRIIIENFISGEIIPDIELNFKKFPCISSYCEISGRNALPPLSYNIINNKNIKPTWKYKSTVNNVISYQEIENCKLSELIKKEGVGTYIIRACETIPPIIGPIQIPETSNYNTKYIKSHGMMTCSEFDIPFGVNVITLINLDETLPVMQVYDSHIERFLNDYDLFENNNTTKIKTKECKDLEKYLDEKIYDQTNKHIMNIRNHVGPIKINDIELNFEQEPCNDYTCTIMGFKPKSKEFPKNISLRPTWKMIEKGFDGINDNIIPSTKLNIYNLSDLINKEGAGTYIIRACRAIPKKTCEETRRFMRQTSDNADK
jgi:hypothetical protein